MTERPTTTVRRVVVGLDGSPPSEQALNWAASFAQCTSAELEVVIAWTPLVEWERAWIPTAPDWNPAAEAAGALELALGRVFGAAIPSKLRRRVVESNPAKALIRASRGADALVVGHRGHGGFAGLLLGSVSSACAAHAECPVGVVHGDRVPAVVDGDQ